MTYQFSDISVAAGISACLLLHHSKNDVTEINNEVVNIPNHVSCSVNMRPIELTRLGQNCLRPKKSLVNRAREEGNTFLIGDYNIIFTSYKISENEDKNDLVMTSTLDNEQNDKIRYHATPLTKKIILAAIGWIRGKVPPGDDDSTKEDLLLSYFDAMKEHMPLQGSLELDTATTALKEAHKFINDREWPSEANPRKSHVLQVLTNATHNGITDPIQFLRLCNFVRRFIYDYVAKHTQVVGHIIDGLHRLTALESALIGFDDNRLNDKRLNDNRQLGGSIGLPAAEFVIVIKTFIPTDEVLNDASFLEHMKALSSTIQNSIGCLQRHKKKEFFAMMIQGLEEKCPGEYMDDQVSTSIIQMIEYFSEKIIELICDKSGMAFHHKHMVSGMKLQRLMNCSTHDWSILFRKKARNASGYENHSFLFDNYRLTVLHFISQYGDIRHPTRYSRGVFNAEVFELAQIMLWSRISKQSYDQLLNFFTKSSVTSVRQLTANDPDGTLMNQWISGFVDTVGTTVYYLFKLYIVNATNDEGDGSHSEMVLMSLIKGVLKGTTEFFSKYGLDPAELPDWFTQIKGKEENETAWGTIIDDWLSERNMMDGRYDDVKMVELRTRIHGKLKKNTSEIWVNFLSFIRVSFALNLNSHFLIKTGGRSKVATFHYLGVTESPSDMCLLNGTNAEGKLWTACISGYALEFEQIEPDIPTLLAKLVRTYLDSKYIQPKKKNKETEVVNVEPQKPSTQEYASMKAVIMQFKKPTVMKCLQDKLQDCDDPVTTAKLKKLLTSINECDPTLLNRCYVDELDYDGYASSAADEENGKDLYEEEDDDNDDDEKDIF